jgi:hypothetical protein
MSKNLAIGNKKKRNFFWPGLGSEPGTSCFIFCRFTSERVSQKLKTFLIVDGGIVLFKICSMKYQTNVPKNCKITPHKIVNLSNFSFYVANDSLL